MAQVFRLLGIRAHREEHRLLGVEGRWRSTQSQGKKRKKYILEHTQKRKLLIVLCMCSQCMGRWFAGVAWQVQHGEILLNMMLKIAQCQGIDVELPLQVGACHLFHGDGAVMPPCPRRHQFCAAFLQELVCQQCNGRNQKESGHGKKKKPHSLREGQAREGNALGGMALEMGGVTFLGLHRGTFFIFHLLIKPFPSRDQPPIHLDHMTNHLTKSPDHPHDQSHAIPVTCSSKSPVLHHLLPSHLRIT